MRPSAQVRAADAYCRVLVRQHYENFIVASPFVSARARHDLARIYAFCRTTDDLGDERGNAGLERLTRWRGEVEELFAGVTPAHPVLLVLADTVRRCKLDSAPFFALIDANVQDQSVRAYPTWADLEAYCQRSAAPVGRMVLGVSGIRDPHAERLSDDVCIGLQLANFAQDVARDAAIGRTYLIGSDLETRGSQGAVQALCERARDLLSSGETLERMVPLGLRLQLTLYRLGGLAICDAVAATGYRTASVRPTLSKQTQLTLVARVLAAALVPGQRSRRAKLA